jgi:hypothetical protein
MSSGYVALAVVQCAVVVIVVPAVESLQLIVQHHTAVYTSVMLLHICLPVVLLLQLALALLHLY